LATSSAVRNTSISVFSASDALPSMQVQSFSVKICALRQASVNSLALLAPHPAKTRSSANA
jgi:hypothetical protein